MIYFPEDMAFYICNVCNLTCSHCHTLSNYNFQGWFPWKDHASYYEEWSKKVHFPEISLIGGEPFLNKELLIWAENIKRLWPNSNFLVETNGTFIKLDKLQLISDLLDMGFKIKISAHSSELYNQIKKNVLDILQSLKSNFEIHNCVENDLSMEKILCDGRILFEFQKVYEFLPSTASLIENGNLYFTLGDEKSNHDSCMFNDCYTMMHGLLYKCQFTATYAASKKIFKYENHEVRNILDQYLPCSPFDHQEEIKSFIDNITDPISSCKACTYSGNLSIYERVQPIIFNKKDKKFLKNV